MIQDNYRTCYEVFVYSFFDSDGDGIGDLKGLTEKLDLSLIHIFAGSEKAPCEVGLDGNKGYDVRL